MGYFWELGRGLFFCYHVHGFRCTYRGWIGDRKGVGAGGQEGMREIGVEARMVGGIRKQTGEMVGNSNIIGIGYGTADENGY